MGVALDESVNTTDKRKPLTDVRSSQILGSELNVAIKLAVEEALVDLHIDVVRNLPNMIANIEQRLSRLETCGRSHAQTEEEPTISKREVVETQAALDESLTLMSSAFNTKLTSLDVHLNEMLRSLSQELQ